ncbi:hypothetical protein EVAR_64878_1 [Eumeta japonica]|uniref:Uncharacterized protein n=1 Tax=Eumeta variegata TaxID=151549 RepID=A0A4C2A3H6_EUMVA|nr:hypothetical protein EVAR_64878_1 [Eumeta japonica]
MGNMEQEEEAADFEFEQRVEAESESESSEMNSCCPDEENPLSLTEEKKLMRDIFAAINEINCLKEGKQQKQGHSLPFKDEESYEKIKNKLKCMQQKICKLTEYLNKKDHHEGSHQKSPTYFDPAICLSKAKEKSSNDPQQLKDNYLYLLTEFTKKDEQLKELTKMGDSCSSNESELHLLRNRLNEMKEEQIEFKCLMKEQSLQLEEYRNKYLTAQQKVEEQTALIEKLNMNNKCIEKQINLEIKEIRSKFQERLTDLLQYPKLLENEQIKLSKVCKEKEEIENKLIIVCKELKTLKLKTQNNNTEDCRPQLIRCQQELDQVKKKMEEMQQQRDMFCEQLRCATDDLNLLRSESAKIIARTKERTEYIKQQQQEQIDRLERLLAQCRATANISK